MDGRDYSSHAVFAWPEGAQNDFQKARVETPAVKNDIDRDGEGDHILKDHATFMRE